MNYGLQCAAHIILKNPSILIEYDLIIRYILISLLSESFYFFIFIKQ
ncbi:hypothetical protein VINI7043_25998 [Vibrio nigripulchritudo ATCC 27043]|nr:hypothetical protein VINI7043_25998 [Vibrio nigripulchritudo ATCC 27043]